jgi:ATP-dependent Clp protease adaptor protein ClpS
MPLEPGLADPLIETRELPADREDPLDDVDGPYVVILYNDDIHSADEVVSQVQKATGYPIMRCIEIMFEAHSFGRSIAFTGSQEACERSANVLRQIRLQVETDKF